MGKIKCSHCTKVRAAKGECPHCKHYRCYISIWWKRRGQAKGREWQIRKFPDGLLLDYDRAEAMLGEIRLKILAGKFDPLEYTEGGMKERTFGVKADRWLTIRKREMDKDIIRPSSYHNMHGHMMNYLVPFFENYDVKEITKEDLARFRDSLADIKNKTKKNIFMTLHAFFTWLYKDISVPVPPFPPLEPTDDSEERDAMEMEEQLEALKRIPEGIERDMLELGMELGIRPGELIVLKVKDFDMARRCVRISRTVSHHTHVLEGTKGRSLTGNRKKGWIPLSDRAAVLVVPYVKDRFGEEWLFINPATGDRFSIKAPIRIWRRYTDSPLTYYEASRHSFLTQLSDLGVDVLDLKELARHSDIRTTQKYIHKRQDHLREKVNLRHGLTLIDCEKNGGNN